MVDSIIKEIFKNRIDVDLHNYCLNTASNIDCEIICWEQALSDKRFTIEDDVVKLISPDYFVVRQWTDVLFKENNTLIVYKERKYGLYKKEQFLELVEFVELRISNLFYEFSSIMAKNYKMEITLNDFRQLFGMWWIKKYNKMFSNCFFENGKY